MTKHYYFTGKVLAVSKKTIASFFLNCKDREDMLQEAFLLHQEVMSKFDIEYSDAQYFVALKNFCINTIKKQGVDDVVTGDYCRSQPTECDGIEHRLLFEESVDKLKGLRADFRDILTAVVDQPEDIIVGSTELNRRDLSKKLGIPYRTMCRSVDALRAELQREELLT